MTVPGATRPFRPHSQFFNSQDSLSTQVNGQSRLANNVMLDGIDNNHKTGLLTVVIPSADAIETVSVSTSNKVNGRTNAELRVDGFNATNSPHFTTRTLSWAARLLGR